MKKRIILIWDLDGAIGQINSTFPYNFRFEQLGQELENVRSLLKTMEQLKIKSCFAVTGFSAEEGKYPYVFPELIAEISEKGHEIASHSWRHEWTPLFTRKQIDLSLKRSKSALENCTANGSGVVGFVPPHNRPMTWIRRAAFSAGDRGIYPLFEMGDTSKLIESLRLCGFKWIRISYQNLFQKFGLRSKNITGRVYEYKDMMILENHYTGFDQTVIDHILNTNYETYTVSAHPLMLSFANKKENKKNFENFIDTLLNKEKSIEFVTPAKLMPEFCRRTLLSNRTAPQ